MKIHEENKEDNKHKSEMHFEDKITYNVCSRPEDNVDDDKVTRLVKDTMGSRLRYPGVLGMS